MLASMVYAAAKELADRPCLGGRLDDHQRWFRRQCWVFWPCHSWDILGEPGIVASAAIRTTRRELALQLHAAAFRIAGLRPSGANPGRTDPSPFGRQFRWGDSRNDRPQDGSTTAIPTVAQQKETDSGIHAGLATRILPQGLVCQAEFVNRLQPPPLKKDSFQCLARLPSSAKTRSSCMPC